jgi:hypothetical protein
MSKRDLTVYSVIELPDSSARMSVLFIDNELTMPSIAFKNHVIFGTNFFDNDKWIFETFYPLLQKWKNRTLTTLDKETELYQEFKGDEWEEGYIDHIIDLIEEAIDFGWNKLI